MYHFFKRSLRRQGLCVKKATIDNLSQLQDLSKTTFKETYPDYIKTKTESKIHDELERLYNFHHIETWITNAQHHCFIIQTESIPHQIIGFSLLILKQNQAYLSKIYLSQAYQGKGLGRILLEANYDFLRKKPEIETLMLDVWDKNQIAKNFYIRMGFRETGDKILYPESDSQNPFFDKIFIRDKINPIMSI